MVAARNTVMVIGLVSALLGFGEVVRAQQPVTTFTSDGNVVVVEQVEGGATVVTSPAGAAPAVPPAASPYAPPPGHPSPPGKPDQGGDHKGKPGEPKGKPEGSEQKPGEKPGEKEGKPGEEKEADETPKTIQRPTEPPKPPNPEELKIRPDEEGKIRLNFNGQPWQGVLELLADLSGMSLDWQELPGDYLNLTTQRSYTIDEARDLINRHLLARGYTLLRNGEILSVVNTKKLDPGMVPRVAPEALDAREPHEFVKVCFSLDWLMAETAVEEFKPLLSPNGKLTALTATNRVEAIDAVINLREIYRLLRAEQSDDGQERLVREFKLEHARASEVREQVLALLGKDSKSGAKGPMTPQQMEQAKQQAKMMAEMQKQQRQQQGKSGGPAIKKPQGDVTLVADQRNNRIVAHAPPDKMAVIEQAIKLLDVPSQRGQSLLAYQSRMQIYRLETVGPEPLVKTLEELGDLDPTTRLEVDAENNAIIAFASLADHVTIRTLVDKLDGGGRQPVVIQLETLDARSVAKTVDFMMGGGKKEEGEDEESRRRNPFDYFDRYSSYGSRGRRRDSGEHADTFRVDADARNNTLLLWANEFEVVKVQDLLTSLRQISNKGNDLCTVMIHRLVTIDPEPLVKTLEDMGALDFRTTLEVDAENGAIIARGTAEDHATIRALIEQLDGSGRQFHVLPLRRLEADYVAGTIEFMMAGKEDKSRSGNSRTYVYNEYFGGGPSRKDRERKPDEFRVDADLEYNRLLLWANDIEVEEVTNLLVKLGEVPPEGGDPSTIRVLDVFPGPDRERLLEHIRRAWPSLAPNPLLMPPAEEENGGIDEKAPAIEATQPEAEAKTAASGPVSSDPAPTGAPEAEEPHYRGALAANMELGQALFRLARFQPDDAQPDDARPDDVQPEAPVTTEAEPAPAAKSAAKSDSKPDSKPDSKSDSKSAANSDSKSDSKPDASAAQPAVSPEQPPSDAAPDDPGTTKPPAPVSITQAPDGRLVITSEDSRALDRLEELMTRLAPPRQDYKVYRLKYAEAYWVRWNLDDFFKDDEKKSNSSSPFFGGWYGDPWSSGESKDSSRRLSKRRPLKFISDDTTNTILVQGADPTQRKTIEDLIELYDQPQLTDRETARKTEVFQIRYSKAEIVAEAIKDVYRDLLSSRDKALAKNQQDRQRPEPSFMRVFGDSDGEAEKRPRFKGLLSIGVDNHSNSLVVSAPAYLFDNVAKMIERLDDAAKPVDAVRVVKVGEGMNASQLRDTLERVLGDGSSGRRTAGGPPKRPSGSDGPRPRRVGPGPQNRGD